MQRASCIVLRRSTVGHFGSSGWADGTRPAYILSMTEVIFERIVPIFTVKDVDGALARYRRLGFATELDEPAQYGFAERSAVQLHLQPDDPGDPGGTGGLVTSVYPTLRPCTRSGRRQVLKVGSWGRTTRPTAFASLSTPTPTGLCTRSVRRLDQGRAAREPQPLIGGSRGIWVCLIPPARCGTSAPGGRSRDSRHARAARPNACWIRMAVCR